MFLKIISLSVIFIFMFVSFSITIDVSEFKQVADSMIQSRLNAERLARIGYFLSLATTFLKDVNLSIKENTVFAETPQIVCYIPSGPTRSTPAYNPETGYCETWPLDEFNKCPERYIYSQFLKTCVDSPTCTLGAHYNPNTKQCESVIETPGSQETPNVPERACAVDLNLNGELEPNEVAQCITSDTGQELCPLDMSPCRANQTPVSCPTGYTYNSSVNKCTQQPSCSSGTIYNTTYDLCVGSTPNCPPGYTFNSSADRCQTNPTCIPGWVYNSTYVLCTSQPTESCPSGLTLNPVYHKCYTSYACGTDYNPELSTGRCKSVYQVTNSYVIGLYNVVLGRLPDTGGYRYWSNYFSNPPSYDNVVAFVNAAENNYLSGAEISGRPPCYYNTVSQPCGRAYAEEIIAAYVWFLGRCPEYSGMNYWCAQGNWAQGGSDRYSRLGSFEIGAKNSGECGSCPSYPWTWGSPQCGGCPRVPSLQGCPCPPEFINRSNLTCSIQITNWSGYCYFNGSCASVPGTTLQQIGSYYYCARDSIRSCSQGTYRSDLGLCVMNPSCAAGGTLNQSLGLCIGSVSCPSGQTYNSTVKKCVNSARCDPGGSLNRTTDLCEASASCPNGTPPEQGMCFSGYSCPLGDQYACVPVNGTMMCSAMQCITASNIDTEETVTTAYVDDGARNEQGECLGQVYIFNGKKSVCRKSGVRTGFKNCCKKTSGGVIADSTGSIGAVFSVVKHGGEILLHAYRAVRLASFFAQGETYIAAYEKSYLIYNTVLKQWHEIEKGTQGAVALAKTAGQYGQYQGTVNGATIMKVQTGDIPSSYIAKEYLSAAGKLIAVAVVHLAISNLIKDPQLAAIVNLAADAIFLALGWIPPIGFALAVLSAIASFFLSGCNKDDIITNNERESGRCHYVGDYCQVRVPLVGCIQAASSYCCFNSKLARIVHEQGRPQLSTDIRNWGSAKKPNCRGFTPEEFASLDFDKIDLSEYIEDLTRNMEQNVENLIQHYFDRSSSTVIERTQQR